MHPPDTKTRAIDVRLIDRNDTSLVLALVASALVVFQKPLRVLVDAAHAVELHYNIDLLPGLTVLVGAFGFHQYNKRHQAKAAETAAAGEAVQARARSAELERLVAFGRALGNALDPASTKQVFWRYMPAFAPTHELWMLTRRPDGWEAPFQDATAHAPRGVDALELVASAALAQPFIGSADSDGVLVGDDLCFPMVVGEMAIGVVGVRASATLSASERQAVSAAAALLAIAIRNGQLLAQTHESSIRDSLTGCFNRAYAVEALSTELQRAARTRRPLSAVMFDIDQFKTINDQFGHLTGDAILSAIGGQLTAMLRATDVKCRYGGDEFLLILPDTVLAGAEHVATALLAAISDLHVPAKSGTVSPTISVGVAVARTGETDPTVVIAEADEALYRAKRAGRNRYDAARLAPTG